MTSGELCNRDVVFIGRKGSVQEAAHLMRKHHVGALVVTDERGGERIPAGIVTDRDLVVEVLAQNVDINAVTMDDIMSEQLITADERDDIWETVRRMRACGVRRVPVVDASGKLAGIIALDDVLAFLSEELAELARVPAREQHHEQDHRI